MITSTRELAFTDPISGQDCSLFIPPGGEVLARPGEPKIGVKHPGCPEIADLSLGLDAFYCPSCSWNGRVSGIWAFDAILKAQS